MSELTMPDRRTMYLLERELAEKNTVSEGTE